MTYEEAKAMVDTAIEQRRKFGKHFTVSDMPPEFLDALVVVHSHQVTSEEHERAVAEQKRLHDEVVLLNRQLGAAKARETALRKKLAGEEKAE